MGPDKETIRSFYTKALNDYLDAIEVSSAMFDDETKPEESEYRASAAKLKTTEEKLRFIVSISKVKYDLDFGSIPVYVLGAKAGNA